MAGLTEVPAGSTIFVDSSILVYHFSGASEECRGFLGRCERREVEGVTSVTVLSEVTHRLMMLEALATRSITRGNLARKVAMHPDLVRSLRKTDAQVAQVPLMGIEVLPLSLGTFLRSAEIRQRHGLLTNDSLVVATMRDHGTELLASADGAFARIGAIAGIDVYAPGDLE